MIIKSPFVITSRLKPGLMFGKDTISIAYGKYDAEGRMVYDIWIDIGKKHFHITDLRSGVGGGSLQEGMKSLLSFLGAAAESYRYEMQTRIKGENTDLFPARVTEWAYQHSDELAMLACEIEETPNLIEE